MLAEIGTYPRFVVQVNGIAKPREVLAIIGECRNMEPGLAWWLGFEEVSFEGSSGSGKTTLLNALNFRNQGKFRVNGEVRVNGQLIRSTEMIASISGYVQQDVSVSLSAMLDHKSGSMVTLRFSKDMFISSLKVKEHLMFQVSRRQSPENEQTFLRN